VRLTTSTAWREGMSLIVWRRGFLPTAKRNVKFGGNREKPVETLITVFVAHVYWGVIGLPPLVWLSSQPPSREGEPGTQNPARADSHHPPPNAHLDTTPVTVTR